MANQKTGKYYTPVYRAKKTWQKQRQERLVKSSVLVVLSVSILAIVWFLFQSDREKDHTLVAEAAAENAFAGIASYPRIVDAYHPVGSSYVPDNLVSLNTVPNGESVYLRADAAEQFLKMLGDMAKSGIAVIPVRGYVSYEEQSTLVKNRVDQLIAEGYSSYDAEDTAWEDLPSPGESEAQLGTSVEVSTELDSVEKFASTAQYRWLCSNACRYGFVIRSAAAPWCLRYVGEETAERMQNIGCNLDEYVQGVQMENPDAQEEEN